MAACDDRDPSRDDRRESAVRDGGAELDDAEDGEADGFEWERIRDYLAFLGGALRRRRLLVVSVFSSIVGVTIAVLAMLPRTYHVEARLLAQSHAALWARGEGGDATPTRGAAETIRRRENLVALVQATDLVRRWDEHRAPGQRLIDAIRRLVAREGDEQDRIDSMVDRLEQRLTVTVSDTTLTIAIDWSDPQTACELVDRAQQSFLEARHAQEVTALSDSLAILRTHTNGLRRDVDDAMTALDDLRARRRPNAEVTGATAGAAAGATPGAPAPPLLGEPGPDTEQIQITLAAKQRALDDLEALRRHRLAELRTRLAEERATYTDNHPMIGDLQATIDSLSTPSPELKALREEVASLRARERRAVAVVGSAARAQLGAGVAPAPGRAANEILLVDPRLQEERDPAMVYARARLRDAIDKLAASREKVEAAQIDLETAEIAFKYRYSVVTPAKLPKGPTKPKVAATLVAAVLAAALGASLLAVIADVRAGRIEERWQIERLLEQPLLAEIDVEAPPRSGAR